MRARLRTLWRALRRRDDFERGLAGELAFHVDARAHDLQRRGLPPAEALRRARIELGAVESHKEECRRSMGLRFPDELRQDLRYAVRVLRRSPAFTAVAALSLALGIGANTAVFSVFNALILRPLPGVAPGQLYFVQPQRYSGHSFPNYRDLRDRATVFSGLAGARVGPMAIETAAGARRVWGYLVTGNYFDTLGVRPALGRFFGPAEDAAPSASPYAVLSYTCWRNRFDGDPRIAGKTVRINTLPYTILGVAPPGFQGTELFFWPEVWVPMAMQPQIEGRSWLDERGTFNTWVLGRLKPGITTRQAEDNLNAIAAVMARENPRPNDGLHFTLTRPGLVGDTLRGPIRAFTAGILMLAGLVLLAACANLANLLAARAADRHRELAIRQSIGAARGRILRQLFTESLLLSLLGGAAGCALAAVLLRFLSRWHAPMDFPVQFVVSPDATVLLFSLAVSLFSGILFGIAPARQAWKADPNHALKTATARPGRRWAFRDGLLAVQVAVCCVLVMGCYVSFRGLARAFSTPLGFEPRHIAAAGYDLGLAHYKPAGGRAFQQRALAAATALPGVTAAAFASSTPLSIDQSSTVAYRDGETDFRFDHAISAAYYDVSPGYFRAMGTRLIAGREFDWHDDANAPPVAIVNETFARSIAGARDIVGRRFLYGSKVSVEIVAVVEDGKYVLLSEAPRPALFRPALQNYNGTTVLLARSTQPEAQVAAQLRQAIANLDAGLPVYGSGSLNQMLGFAFFPARAATVALGAFGILAIMLAVTGIYGMATYAVSRRAREIGIRVAIGAGPRQVLRFVFGRILLLLSFGSAAGLLLGAAAGQALSAVVYQATPGDPVVLIAVPLTMALIGLIAVLSPARKVMSVDPLHSLRSD